nr:uncharacterized protein LOC109742066 [Aegilops tauschii subsp. strangulata]
MRGEKELTTSAGAARTGRARGRVTRAMRQRGEGEDGAVTFCTGRGRGEAKAEGLTSVAGVRGGEARSGPTCLWPGAIAGAGQRFPEQAPGRLDPSTRWRAGSHGARPANRSDEREGGGYAGKRRGRVDAAKQKRPAAIGGQGRGGEWAERAACRAGRRLVETSPRAGCVSAGQCGLGPGQRQAKARAAERAGTGRGRRCACEAVGTTRGEKELTTSAGAARTGRARGRVTRAMRQRREGEDGAVTFCTRRGRGEAEAEGLTGVAGVRGGEAR